MSISFFPIEAGLYHSGRTPSLARPKSNVRIAEWVALAGCGIVAAVAASLPDFVKQVPGHAILRPVVPILCGLALVPRRGSGTIMSLCALLTWLVLPASLGRGGFGNVTSMLTIGPALDLAMLHAGGGWRIYLRAILAGMGANLAAWSVRGVAALLGWKLGGGSGGSLPWSVRLGSHLACGALAGLIGACIWFRISQRQAPPDNGTVDSDEAP